ncbi:MAG: M14 metallopeptidase family protein [Planctomycetota bacterium]
MPTATRLFIALFAAAFSFGSFAQEIPKPEAYFGFPIGADGKLVSYLKSYEYFRELEKRSKWIAIEEIGKTTLGMNQIVAVISKPENLAAGARWKEIAASLLDPRTTNPDTAQKLAAEGKAIVMITCGIHSDEVAAPQTALELAHDLVTNTNLTFDRDKVFENVILLLIPSVNPDGQEMIADWVERTAGTPNEGAPMPKLYHYFAGHDNNRDWFAFNLNETRNISNILYRSWRPHVLVDHHQMGSRGARMFVPPFGDPVNDAVNPLVWRGANLFGTTIAYELESRGKVGVSHDAYFQGWWQGGLSRAPWWHHGIGILTETASANLAFPLALEPGELEAGGGLPSITRPLTRHPNPWKGGVWRVRDICDYQRIATFATLNLAAERKAEILLNTYKMASAAVAAGTANSKQLAYVFPADQLDPAARDRLVEMLRFGGAEVLFMNEPWRAGDRAYPAGSYFVTLAQPFGPYINNLLEDQRYPDWPNTQRPYDITGWTLWRMMGVNCEKVAFDPAIMPKGELLKSPVQAKSQFKQSQRNAKFLAIDPRSNDSYQSARRVIAEQKTLRRSTVSIELEDGRTLPPGAFLVESADAPKDGGWLIDNITVNVAAVAKVNEADTYKVNGPRIGIYESHDPSMDKGWTTLLVDKYIWKPQMVHHDELERVLPLIDNFIIPESSPDTLWDGGARSDAKMSRMPYPKEFRGGIGSAGIKHLLTFVERGGTLIALGTSCDFLIERMDLPVTNILKSVKREDFSCPGSLVNLRIAQNHPITYGMPETVAGFFSSNVAFKTSPSNLNFKRSILFSYPDAGPLLLSGHIKGEEKLYGAAGAVELQIGKGRIVLFGLRVQHRAQTDATFKMLFNAILESSRER